MDCGVVQRVVPLWSVIVATVGLCATTTITVGNWASAATTRDALISAHQIEQDRRIDKLEDLTKDVAEIKAGMKVLLKQKGIEQ